MSKHLARDPVVEAVSTSCHERRSIGLKKKLNGFWGCRDLAVSLSSRPYPVLSCKHR